MGEIDTKSIESVQAALTLFGEKSDKWNRPSNGSNRESEDMKKELEDVLKDIATYRVQLEAREAAHLQTILKLDFYQNTVSEFSTIVKDLEIDRERHRGQYEEARVQIDDLEFQLKKMTDQCLELLNMETDLKMEKEKVEELVKEVLDRDESIVSLKSSAINAEEVKLGLISEKDAEMEKAKTEISQLENELEEMKKASDELVLKLDSINDLKELHGDLEVKKREAMDQALYTESLEMEINQLKEDLENVLDELKKMKIEMREKEERENDMNIEMAELKYELHLGRSKMAGAEAAEIRAKSLEIEFSATLQKLTSKVEESEETENSQIEEDDNSNIITIPMADYKSLIEIERVKKDLEAAMEKVGEFRTRAEQAISRAEMAEKAKSAIEGQLRSWREERQRRKAAQMALREISAQKQLEPAPTFYKKPVACPPLYKVLDMKF